MNNPTVAPTLTDDTGDRSMMRRVLKLPETVQKYLFSGALSALHKQIYARHGVAGDIADVAYLTELEVFVGETDVDVFFEALWARLPWPDADEARAKALCVDILGNVFLPAQAFVGDVNAVIRELGGDPGSFNVAPLEVRQLTYADGVQRVRGLLAAEGLDPDDSARLNHIIESRLRDVRDESETLRMLTKERKTGGLELSGDKAARIIDAMRSEMRMTKFVEEVIGTMHAQPGHGSALATDGEHKDWSPERIKAMYLGSPEEQKEVVTRLETLKKEVSDDKEGLRERLFDAMHPGGRTLGSDAWSVVASLIALTQANALISTIVDDQRFRELGVGYVQARGGYDMDAVRRAPAGRDGMNIFLQLILKAFAGLDGNDSARYGLRVINMLKKTGEAQYADLVAFDLDKGEFAWAQPIILE